MDAEQRLAQAVGSLREVERQQAAGEIDDAQAQELIEHFAARAELASDELRSAGRSVRVGRERLLPLAVVGAVLVLTVVLVVVMRSRDDDRAAAVDPLAEADPQQRSLDDVSNEEMEEVIAQNPDIVPMRLALVERYLVDGELEKAADHAAEAARRATSTDDRIRADVYVGWTTALLGDPAQGAEVLRLALEQRPSDLNARWYLANVLVETGEREEAAAMLRSILDEDIATAQREIVERKLDEVSATG